MERTLVDFLGRLYIVNAPWFVNGIFKIIEKLLPAKPRSKVRFPGTLQDIADVLGEDNVERIERFWTQGWAGFDADPSALRIPPGFPSAAAQTGSTRLDAPFPAANEKRAAGPPLPDDFWPAADEEAAARPPPAAGQPDGDRAVGGVDRVARRAAAFKCPPGGTGAEGAVLLSTPAADPLDDPACCQVCG